ncbi:MAG TPA: hypothetical protein VN894_12360 [Polyangiaceae bacterium]|nr:hypothetical protein [Polyangiaceae bacterium]
MSGISPNNDVLNWGRTARLIAKLGALAAGLPAISRMTSYGEVVSSILSGKQHQLADEGAYFLTRTPTIGTGIAGVTSLATFTAASPFAIVYNSNPVGGKNIWLDYLQLTVTATAASTTSLFLATTIDSTQRYSSAGAGGYGTNIATILAGPNPTNMGSSSSASGALVYAGALVAIAASPNVRTLCNKLVSVQIPVVLDQYTLNFGACDSASTVSNSRVALSAAVPTAVTVPHPPVCIAPGSSFLLYYYGAAMGAAPSFELEIGHVER